MIYTIDNIEKEFSLSNEEINNLKIFVEILLKWQKKINLISSKTIIDIWHRHIADSIQIYKYIKKYDLVTDIGSGGGFPGLVLSILSKSKKNKFFLIEADKRKSLFLNEVVKQLDLNVEVINNRIEKVKEHKTNCVISRALTSIENLIKYTNVLNSKKGVFLKGSNENIKNIKDVKYYKTYSSLTNINSKVILINL